MTGPLADVINRAKF